MNYPEFREELFSVLEKLITEDIDIEILEVEKLNGCLRYGVSFQKEGEIYAPTIYLEPFYNNFQKGKSIESLAEELLRCYQEETCSQIPDCIRKMDSYETAKEDIYVKLIHLEENENLLKNTPYVEYLDFAIVPYFEVNNEQIFKGSVLLKTDILEAWNVTAEDVIKQALVYTKQKKGVWFRSMSDALENLITEEDGEIYEKAKAGMYVLTNNEKYQGAVLAYYPDVLSDIWGRIKEDFYMLPASVHEWVVVPNSQVIFEDALFSMVRDINDFEVMEEEILSYNVYFYDGITQNLSVRKSIKEKNC